MSIRRSDKPERVPAPSTDPYAIGDGPDAALLLHGFSGSPWELRPLAEGLAASGFRCSVPLLPGHGGDPARLAQSTQAEWLAAAHGALDALLAAGHRRVFLGGFSAGGCLAIRVAAERPGDLAALALLAPALGFHGSARLYRGLFRYRVLARLVPVVRKGGMDVRDSEVKAAAPYQPLVPTAAALQLDRLVRAARAALPLVRTPALVLWGALDAVVPRVAAEHAAKRIGSGPARLAIFPRSAHQLAVDLDRQAVAGEVAQFFAACRQPDADSQLDTRPLRDSL